MSLPPLLAVWPAWVAPAIPWTILGVITIVLVVALRSRWWKWSILRRCVVLSLYLHLLIATLAYTTNFLAWRPGDFGFGTGTCEVRVRMTGEDPAPTADAETVPDSEPTPVEPWEPTGEVPTELASAAVLPQKQETAVAPTVEREPNPDPTPELPPLKMPDQPPPASPLESIAQVLADVAPRYADSVTAEPTPHIETPAAPPLAVAHDTSPPVAPSPPRRATNAPDLYQLRFAADRAGVVESAGGNADTEAAVQAALQWLVANQEPDGRWNAARHGAGRGAIQQGQQRGDTGADADTGITGLALLALLGAGHTHLEGEHRAAVQHGLEYLLSMQRSDGCLAGDAKLFAAMYCHGMATLALAEAMAITRDARLRPGLEKAVGFTLAAQHSGGGWRYQPGDVGDMSQFGWQVMALKSAELAGIKVPDTTKQRALRFLEANSSGRSGGLASYRANERPSRTMTAEALLCHHLLHDTPRPAACEEAAAFVVQELPTSGQANVYYCYYGTLALRFTGGPAWERWNESLQRQLLGSQRANAALAGSWDPDPFWGGYGGRVYQTALSTLCLESYYRYDLKSLDK
jgi:hypothetical protein